MQLGGQEAVEVLVISYTLLMDDIVIGVCWGVSESIDEHNQTT